MFLNQLKKTLPFLLILMTWQTVAQWMNISFPYSWAIDWLAEMAMVYIFLMTFLQERKYYNRKIPFFLILFSLILICSLVYGHFFMAEDHHDRVAGLKHFAWWILCVGVLYFENPDHVTDLTSRWVKYAIPFVVILIPFMQGEAIGRYFSPIAFAVCFFPFIKGKGRKKILLVLLLVLVYGALGARSVALRFVIGILVALAIYLRDIITKKILIGLSISLFITPFILFWMAIYTDFNIFQAQEYFGLKDYTVKDGFSEDDSSSSAFADTRTFIYSEVITSAIKNDYVLWGRSLARGNDTYGLLYMEEDEYNIHQERRANEARILNLFTYMGIVGVLGLLLLSISATYNAFRHGRSKIIFIIGTYVAARWVFAWIEDFERFDLINLYLWIPMAMCFSPHFVDMSDEDFKEWASKLL